MPSEPVPESSAHVLLIESDPSVVDALRRALVDAGIAVENVPTALHGIQRLCEGSYDAVVLDLVSPGPMNGFAVISFVETEHHELVERLFIVSGMPEQTIMHAAPQFLPRYYRKPIDAEQVSRAVRDVITGRARPAVPERTRVLIADDDEQARHLTSTIVSRLGLESVEVGDGHEAVRRLASEEFASVVVDLMMPYVDGYGVLRYVREEKPHMLARTIVLTGMPQRYRTAPLLDGICSLLEKPADLPALREAMQSCLRPHSLVVTSASVRSRVSTS